jgi:hypothetical protein
MFIVAHSLGVLQHLGKRAYWHATFGGKGCSKVFNAYLHRATSHTRLSARDHYTSSTLIAWMDMKFIIVQAFGGARNFQLPMGKRINTTYCFSGIYPFEVNSRPNLGRFKLWIFNCMMRGKSYFKVCKKITLWLIHSPHLLVRATIEQRVPALVATNGSHWSK